MGRGTSSVSLRDQVAALEAGLDTASTPEAESLAESVVARIEGIGVDADVAERELGVRGLLVASHQLYRTGHLRRAGEVLHSARALMEGLAADLRITVLLRSSDYEMLVYDIGAALRHTAEALALARATRRPEERARALVNYGMALDAAGLYDEADRRWARALDLLGPAEDPRLRGNIWALRAPLGFRLKDSNRDRADEACSEALACALASPVRYRDSMACTALCNWAALDLQRGRLEAAHAHLDRAQSLANLGTRPRWLISVVRAMAAVRERNREEDRAALDALLSPDQAPAAAYVIETVGVMAAIYASMDDAGHAGEALSRLSVERARALWAMLRDVHGTRATVGELPSAGLLERLAVTAELRDDATGRHCYRVGRLAMMLGREAGLAESDLGALELASRLHDIGKIVVPDAILLKPGPLEPTGLHLMRKHTTIGAELLSSGALPNVEIARLIARHHHEAWDGSGYPDGLAGEAIPLPARIAAIADVYDALTHARPYKDPWPHEAAMAYIAGKRGIQFDPRLAGLFIEMMNPAKGALERVLREAEAAAAASPLAFLTDDVA